MELLVVSSGCRYQIKLVLLEKFYEEWRSLLRASRPLKKSHDSASSGVEQLMLEFW